jgi:hypothetical protein
MSNKSGLNISYPKKLPISNKISEIRETLEYNDELILV